jgi:uncharacterized protein YgiM (DUF1202 family)
VRKLLPIFLVLFLTGVSYSQMAVVIGDDAYLRGSPTETGAIVDTLLPGTKVAIIRQQGPWFLIQASPFVGWIHGNSLRLKRAAKSAPASRVSPAETALSPATSASQPPVSVDTKPKTDAPAQTSPPGKPATAIQPSASDKRVYIRGPRGGCYYVKPDGKKVYGDHKLCD